ncbi:LysR substrate binding domain-containing protein [Rhizobium sullae]|uniref:LysR substrate binding domain-containing protein n=1 Tax=Rhizobium sullae TaxID=50338 RepID=A0A4R3QQ31_RHISU|nr:LysR substrate binding domain-containing protein [Rhizobium sullae]
MENIGSLRFFSIAHERYLLAVARTNRLAGQAEISIDDLRSEKIIAFNRQNLSYTERYFNEKFDEYDLTRNIAYSCDDTYSLAGMDGGPAEPGLRAEAGERHRFPDRTGGCLE